jgi:hypothetical protein
VEEIHAAVRARVRDLLPISERRRAELKERLTEEEQGRERRAAAEAEVLRMDADLRAKRIGEARQREESRRRARDEAERQLQEEAERELRSQESSHSRDEAERRATEAALAAASAIGPVTEQLPVIEHRGGDDVQAISRAAEAVARTATPARRAPVDPPGAARLPLVPGFPAGAGQGTKSAAERAAAAALASTQRRTNPDHESLDDEPKDDDPRAGRHR